MQVRCGIKADLVVKYEILLNYKNQYFHAAHSVTRTKTVLF